MNAVPASVALVAGGLAVINPCGFPLLPAFLSFYLGADEHELPRADPDPARPARWGARQRWLPWPVRAREPAGQLRRRPRRPRDPLGRARDRRPACARRS